MRLGWGGGVPVTQGWGAWLALGNDWVLAGNESRARVGAQAHYAESAPNPEICFQNDPTCARQCRPQRRQDQILIAGRLGTRVAPPTSVEGERALRWQQAHPDHCHHLLTLLWVAGRQGWGIFGWKGHRAKRETPDQKKCRRKLPLLQAVHYWSTGGRWVLVQ